jgi:O-antigen/teichoic acid export membrane protein
MVLSIITSVLVARAIGPEGRGIVAALMLFSSAVVVIGNLGVGQGVFFLQSKKEQTPEEGFSVIVATTAAVVAVLIVAVSAAATMGFLPKELSNVWYVVAALTLAAGTFFAILSCDLLRGLGRAQIPAVIPVVVQIPIALVTLGVLVAGGGTAAIVGTSVLAAILNAGLSVWVLYRIGAVRWRFPYRPLAGSVRFGWLLYLNGLFAFGFNNASQGISLQRLGVKELGIFSVAVVLASLLTSLESPVSAAAQYHIAAKSREDSVLLCARLTRILLAVLTVAGACFLVVGPVTIRLAFGSEFSGAIVPFVIYLPSVVMAGVTRTLGSFVLFQEQRSDVVLVTTAAAAVLNIVLSLALVGRWKLPGLAAATTITHVMLFLVFVEWFKRASGLAFRDFLVLTRDDCSLISGLVPRWAVSR